MAALREQIRAHRYVSGWCEAARHNRCPGGYGGTACCCSCHRQSGSPTGTQTGGTQNGGTQNGGTQTARTETPARGSAE